MRHIKKLATRVGNKGTQVTNTETTKKVTPKITIQKSVVVTDRIESPTPVINILTRTSNRPNGFKRCRESIVNQTYKNIRHLVSIDNLNDEEYVKSSNVEYFFMDKEAISKENDIPDPKTGNRFIYNLYLNHLINEVKEGWIFILDDDDYFADNNCVQKMVNAIKNTTDLVLWQMKYPNGQTLPSLQELGAPPKLARISSQCFMVHSGIAKTIRWDGWKNADFRFIQKSYAKTGEKRVIREVLVNLGGVGLGMKKDTSETTSNFVINNMNRNNSEINTNNVLQIFKNKIFKDKGIVYEHSNSSELKNIAIISNSQFQDLYLESKFFYDNINIDKIRVSGNNSYYGYKFINNLILDKVKYPYDWAILIDEDCFITDTQAMLDLLNYQIENNIEISGMPDGGMLPLRVFNPVSINTYFSILNLKKIREKYNEKEVKNTIYDISLNAFIPKEMLKLKYFLNTIPYQNQKCDPYNFEPYYKIFFWLIKNKFKTKYLNAHLWNPNTDSFTNILYNHENKPFAYHTWRSRFWKKDKVNTKRIQNVINHCKNLIKK